MPSSSIEAGLAMGLTGAPLLAYALAALEAKVDLATTTPNSERIN
ncbi:MULTISPECIES: hypothetical protein [unclassified Salinibacterium]|nr:MULTISPECIES: hypothetical protein [unclassified Salinibacterium]